jgi:hypothetical protein
MSFLQLCILVLGALGGRFDHEMGNINVLHIFPNINIILLSNDCLIFLLPRTHAHEIHVERSIEGPHCGLIPIGMPSTSTTTTGLRWNLGECRPYLAWRIELYQHELWRIDLYNVFHLYRQYQHELWRIDQHVKHHGRGQGDGHLSVRSYLDNIAPELNLQSTIICTNTRFLFCLMCSAPRRCT